VVYCRYTARSRDDPDTSLASRYHLFMYYAYFLRHIGTDYRLSRDSLCHLVMAFASSPSAAQDSYQIKIEDQGLPAAANVPLGTLLRHCRGRSLSKSEVPSRRTTGSACNFQAFLKEAQEDDSRLQLCPCAVRPARGRFLPS
jgi:hypothetical protein